MATIARPSIVHVAEDCLCRNPCGVIYETTAVVNPSGLGVCELLMLNW